MYDMDMKAATRVLPQPFSELVGYASSVMG